MRFQINSPRTPRQRDALKTTNENGVRRVCDCLRAYGQPLTSYGVAEELSIPPGAARTILRQAIQRGLVKTTGDIQTREDGNNRRYLLYTTT